MAPVVVSIRSWLTRSHDRIPFNPVADCQLSIELACVLANIADLLSSYQLYTSLAHEYLQSCSLQIRPLR